MNKPTKQEFNDLVNDYINGGMEDMAQIYAELDDYTNYYKGKFWLAIRKWREQA